MAFFIFLVLFSKKYGFIEKSNPSEKYVVEEEEDCNDTDDIGYLESSPSSSTKKVGMS